MIGPTGLSPRLVRVVAHQRQSQELSPSKYEMNRAMPNHVCVSEPITGHDMTIGDTFQAKHFGEREFSGLIDPVIMLDHFRMTGPTFEPGSRSTR